MAAFKKSFLVLAIALLALAGASGTAYAQHPPALGLVTCTSFAAPSLVRAEGIAEIEDLGERTLRGMSRPVAVRNLCRLKA